MDQAINIEVVWNRFRASVKAFLQVKISDPDEVDDLLQQIMIKTHANLHNLKAKENIKAWLLKIAHYTVIDYYRKRAKAKPVAAEDLWYAENDNRIQQELAQCIAPFIQALPEETAELLSQIELNGKSQKEYAISREISYSTLKSRVQKGRRQLLRLFEACCHLSLDKNGTVIDYEPKSNHCDSC